MTSTNNIILVDDNDNEIGSINKMEAHERGLLHRAFSILLFHFHNGVWQCLLHQRNSDKYHSGGLWTNTCCSHPYEGETTIDASKRRLEEEMGIKNQDLQEVGVFHYRADFQNGLIENEVDHVLIGVWNKDSFYVNPEEVSDCKWLDVDFVEKDLIKNSCKYSFWFSKVFQIATKGLSQI